MPSRRTTILLLSTIAVAALICWLMSDDKPLREVSRGFHYQGDASRFVGHQRSDAARQEPDGGALGRTSTSSAAQSDSSASYDAYLRHNRFSADAYAAVVDLTADENLLKEGLAKFPESGALLARGAWLSADPAFALECAKSLRRLEPDASLGDYLTAMLMAKQGFEPSAITEILVAALEKGPPASYDRKAISGRREALESIGTPEFDARMQSLYGPIALNATVDLLLESTAGMIDCGDPMLVEAAIAMTQHFLYRPGIAVITQIGAAKSQLNLLSAVPPEYEFGDSETTIGERKAELSQQLKDLGAAIDFSVSEIARMTRSEKISLADSIRENGEYKAITEMYPENR